MMFQDAAVTAVFAEYQARIAAERPAIEAFVRGEGTVRLDDLLLPIGPETGAVLHALVLARKPRRLLELGTSYGYSTLILADAARAVGGTLVSIDLADYKQAYAREMLVRAGLSSIVDFRLGDAPALIAADPGPFDFVLVDIWKDLYIACFDALWPKLSPKAIVAADNMIDPPMARTEARAYRAAVRARADMSTCLLPIGSGIELSVKWPADAAEL